MIQPTEFNENTNNVTMGEARQESDQALSRENAWGRGAPKTKTPRRSRGALFYKSYYICQGKSYGNWKCFRNIEMARNKEALLLATCPLAFPLC